jgi:hypothetical protein
MRCDVSCYVITLSRAGSEYTSGVTQITALNPTTTLTVYQSRLTVNVDSSALPSYWFVFVVLSGSILIGSINLIGDSF